MFDQNGHVGTTRFVPEALPMHLSTQVCSITSSALTSKLDGIWTPGAVATGYDKLAGNYLAFLQLASIRLWLRANESAP